MKAGLDISLQSKLLVAQSCKLQKNRDFPALCSNFPSTHVREGGVYFELGAGEEGLGWFTSECQRQLLAGGLVILLVVLFKYFLLEISGEVKVPQSTPAPLSLYVVSSSSHQVQLLLHKQTHPVGTPPLKFNAQGMKDVKK